jgi:site-specific recombinase XerD
MLLKHTDGLSKFDGFEGMTHFPFFLTEGYKPIEAPNLWMVNIATSTTKSKETIKQYSSHLARFLKWLDSTGRDAEKWADVTLETIRAYVKFLTGDELSGKAPKEKVIEGYIATLGGFYRWAAGEQYRVAWDANTETISVIVRDAMLTGAATIEKKKRPVKLTRERDDAVKKMKGNFVTDEMLNAILPLFDDPVYSALAYTMRQTGLRANGALQLPFNGGAKNIDLRHYDLRREEVPDEVNFRFKSKGKPGDIMIRGAVWGHMCQSWMDKFVRMSKEREANGKGFLSQHYLFVNKYGRRVTYRMLITAFEKVRKHRDFPKALKKFTPHMLRTSFATYFVLNAHKEYNLQLNPVYNIKIDSELKRFLGHEHASTSYTNYVRFAAALEGPNVAAHLIDKFLPESSAVLHDIMADSH